MIAKYPHRYIIYRRMFNKRVLLSKKMGKRGKMVNDDEEAWISRVQ